jgi:hypothetical protein
VEVNPVAFYLFRFLQPLYMIGFVFFIWQCVLCWDVLRLTENGTLLNRNMGFTELVVVFAEGYIPGRCLVG